MPCSTPSKPTQCGEQQPWDQSPREHCEPGMVTGTLRLIREIWATSGGLNPVPSAHFAVARSNVPEPANCGFDPILRRRFRGATRPRNLRILGSVKAESGTQRNDGPTPASPIASKIRLQGTLNAGRLPILRKTRPRLRMSPSESTMIYSEVPAVIPSDKYFPRSLTPKARGSYLLREPITWQRTNLRRR